MTAISQALADASLDRPHCEMSINCLFTIHSKRTPYTHAYGDLKQNFASPTVMLELQHILVKLLDPLGTFGEPDSIARHGIPVADRP